MEVIDNNESQTGDQQAESPVMPTLCDVGTQIEPNPTDDEEGQEEENVK